VRLADGDSQDAQVLLYVLQVSTLNTLLVAAIGVFVYV
jgi:hypothetical protein